MSGDDATRKTVPDVQTVQPLRSVQSPTSFLPRVAGEDEGGGLNRFANGSERFERLERFEPQLSDYMADYDVIVVGSGLGGLTAGLFAARHGLSTLVLEANIPGGHLISIEKIEDFPGFPDGTAGYDLCPTVQRQAADQGAEFQRAEVSKPRSAGSLVVGGHR